MNVSVLDSPCKQNHTVNLPFCVWCLSLSVVFSRLQGPFRPELQLWSGRVSKSPWVFSAFLYLSPVTHSPFVPFLGNTGNRGGQASASLGVCPTSPTHILQSQPVNRTRHQGKPWVEGLESWKEEEEEARDQVTTKPISPGRAWSRVK